MVSCMAIENHDEVSCDMVAQTDSDYIIKVYKEFGEPVFIQVPKCFHEWSCGEEPIGLNLVFSGHYE